MDSRHAGQRHGGVKRGAFRAWRRARPFWGGLLMLLAGLELLSLPLSGVLLKGQIRLVIYIGIGGVFGVLIGVLLLVAGLVVWINPTHRVFYGIAGIVLGIVSFPASNLGGFFLGMLLAIVGGALAFAWTPGRPAPLPFPPGSENGHPDDGGPPGGHDGPPNNRNGWSAHGPSLDDTQVDLSAGNETGRGGSARRLSGPGARMLTAGGAVALAVAGVVGTGGAAHAASTCGILGLLCPSPSATSGSGSSAGSSGTGSSAPAPGASSGSPGPIPSLSPSSGGQAQPSGAASPPPGKTGNSNKNAKVKNVKAASGLVVPSATGVLAARSSTMTKLNFVGVATLPVGGGGSERALEFTASSASLSSLTITVTQSGSTVVTKTASLGLPDGMTLYTTKLCGQIEGIAPSLCFTPDTASQVALKLASVLGKTIPITMTNVTASQFVDVSPAAQWGALTIAAA